MTEPNPAENKPHEHLTTLPTNLFSLTTPSDARNGVFNLLFFNQRKGWQLPFGLMLMLSAGIATLGLSQNSAATVIGAMIIAPLGQPIIALGAAVALGWPSQFIRLFILTCIGAASVVLLAFGFGVLLPTETPTAQILARTAPDLRDLGVAIFAGTAGAFGYYRSEFSTVLSGVAVAVALVPPLCVCGMMLEEGRYILATGAFILFAANFVGIALSAILVFFVSGAAHVEQRRGWFIGGALVTTIAMAMILGPLIANYKQLRNITADRRAAYAAAAEIIKSATGNPVIIGLSIDGGMLAITLRPFPSSPAEIRRLTNEIAKRVPLQVELIEQSE